MLALFDLGNKINVIHLTFVEKLGFIIQSININAQKIDVTILETYEIIIVVFLVINWANKIKFFEEIVLVINISLDVVFRMFFFI